VSHPENAELLAGIVAHPEDDDRRLVYADWLEENGDPERAGFIRAQVQLAACSPADESFPDLVEQHREATSVLRSRAPDEPALPRGVGFYNNWEESDPSYARYQRGFPFFVDEPDVDGGPQRRHVRPFRDALSRLVETTTLRGLHLGEWGSRFLPQLLATPAAEHFSALSADTNPDDEISPGVVAGIADSPIAGSLRWLKLIGGLETGEVETLAAGGVLARLTRLEASLEGERRIVRRLPDWFGQLRRFSGRISLRHPRAGNGHVSYGRQEVGIERLAKLPHLHTLKTTGAFGGVTNLARAKGFPSLGALELSGGLRGEGATLARAALPKLASLDLRGCGLRNDDLGVMCESALFANLRILSLPSNQIGDRGVAALAKSPCASRLRILRLGDNPFGRQGLAALAKPGAFPRLTTLDLSSSDKRKASAEDVTRFLTSLNLPHLRHLSLEGWPVDNAGARAIAGNPAFGRLTMLDLDGCEIRPTGVAALFGSAHLRGLVKLDLCGNPLSTRAIEALLDAAILPELCECWLPYTVDLALMEPLKAARKTQFIFML
jgi:uncharacterized protein (TIGR02996 family)